MAPSDPSKISPTAHYTSFVWFKNGMSHRNLATPMGRLFFYSLQPFNLLSWALSGGVTIERFLLQRHKIIDHLLGNAIERRGVNQVLEVAAGLSPRGLRMSDEYRSRALRYVEADLPDMAKRKESLLKKVGAVGDNHLVTTVNVLRDDGDDCLSAVAERHLDSDTPTAIVTEGLVNYFDRDMIKSVWTRFATMLKERKGGVYLSDIVVTSDVPRAITAKIFRGGLNKMTRGNDVVRYFKTADDVIDALKEAGFRDVTLHQPESFKDRLEIPSIRGGDVIRIIEARV